jgi:hypothetical protein
MNEENQKFQMELYKIFNQRTNEAIKEFYRLNEVFLIINSGLLAFVNFSANNFLSFFTALVGIFISILWFQSSKTQHKFKLLWIEEVKKIERNLNIEIWRREKQQRIAQETGPIYDKFKWLVILFLITWSGFALYFFFKLSLL